jgi:hypothetical protein
MVADDLPKHLTDKAKDMVKGLIPKAVDWLKSKVSEHRSSKGK